MFDEYVSQRMILGYSRCSRRMIAGCLMILVQLFEAQETCQGKGTWPGVREKLEGVLSSALYPICFVVIFSIGGSKDIERWFLGRFSHQFHMISGCWLAIVYFVVSFCQLPTHWVFTSVHQKLPILRHRLRGSGVTTNAASVAGPPRKKQRQWPQGPSRFGLRKGDQNGSVFPTEVCRLVISIVFILNQKSIILSIFFGVNW